VRAAAAPVVQASVSPRLVGVGQQADYAIVIQGSASIGSAPESVRVEGLDIGPPSRTTYEGSSGGARFVQLRLAFPVVPLRAGTFTIPPQEVVVDGVTRTTPAVRLVAQAGAGPASDTDPTLKVSVAEPLLYPGQVTAVQIALYVHQSSNLLNLPLPEISHPNFVIKRPERPDRQREVVGDQPFIVYTYHTSLQAIQPGEFTLGPVRAEANISFPDAPAGVGGFFQRMVSRTFVLTSNTVPLTIRPLPPGERPASFAGAVGRFRLDVAATPTELNVGDPLALDVTVSGQGNFDAVTPPLFPEGGGWRLYPPTTLHENRSLGLQPGVVRFNQVVVPEQLTDALPSLEFSYFDPELGEFVVLKSDPLPLVVSPDPGARLPVESASFAPGSPGVEVPEEDLGDILESPVRVPLAWRTGTVPVYRRPLFWVAQAVPASLLLALAAVGLRRRLAERAPAGAGEEPVRDPGAVLREIRTAPLDDARDVRRFYRLVHEFLGRAAEAGGGGAPGDPAWAELAAAAERAAFGVGGPACPLAPAERDRVVGLLERLA
jgi:hypothetical protein